MQAVGIDFFQRGGHKYLLLMDHFLGCLSTSGWASALTRSTQSCSSRGGLPLFAVERGYAWISQSMAVPAIEEEDTPEQAASGQSDTAEQDGNEVLDEEAEVESAEEEL
jgi:hypothetical protein